VLNNLQKKRKTQELRETYTAPGLVADIKTKRMQWLGPVIRMNKTRMATRIFDRKPETVNAQSPITGRCRE
jgi:hypothetical protein